MGRPDLVYLRSSDGTDFSVPIESLANLPYFSYIRSLSFQAQSTIDQRLTIDLLEPADVLQPIFAHLNGHEILPDFDILDLDIKFSIFQAACKYGILHIAQEARLHLRSTIFINHDVRDRAMQLAIRSGDADMIQFTATVIRELGSLTVPAQEDLNPSGFNVNADLPRVHALAEQITAAKARKAPASEINALMEQQAQELATLRRKLVSESAQMDEDIGMPRPTYASHASGSLGGSSSRPTPIPNLRNTTPFIRQHSPMEDITETNIDEESPPAYDQVEREQVLAIANDSPSHISNTSFPSDYGRLNHAREETELVRLRGPPSEIGVARIPEPAEPGRPLRPEPSQGGARGSPQVLHGIRHETRGNPSTLPKAHLSPCIPISGLLFLLLTLGGIATELGLTMLTISQGTQATEQSISRGLMAKVACTALDANTTGSCNPPFHWSIIVAYLSPITLSLALFFWACDRERKAKCTNFMIPWAMIFTLVAVGGTTALAAQGYASSECNQCPNQMVYVPLQKLRDMNRGQAAGAWFEVIGVAFSYVLFKSVRSNRYRTTAV